jgi:hypothetical protein
VEDCVKRLLFVLLALALAVGSIAHAQVQSFSVTANNLNDYTINGQPDPTLTVVRGGTYTFNVNAAGHPFFIKTVQGPGTGNAYNVGVTNNGTQSGAVTWTVAQSAPNNLFYNCSNHSAMTGTITVLTPVPGATPYGTMVVALLGLGLGVLVLRRRLATR